MTIRSVPSGDTTGIADPGDGGNLVCSGSVRFRAAAGNSRKKAGMAPVIEKREHVIRTSSAPLRAPRHYCTSLMGSTLHRESPRHAPGES